jgi:4-hydroxy-3-methylbut-2-enyl diphosphate reductase
VSIALSTTPIRPANGFPDRTIYLTGEIIHNPHVNEKLRAMGIRFLTDEADGLDRIGPTDVVILPAFGVTVAMLEQLDRRGATLVDTTCGSVLNVWKNVRRYSENGYTSVIHGKVWHEETQATASQAVNTAATTWSCSIAPKRHRLRLPALGRAGRGAAPALRQRDVARLRSRRAPRRIGLANQTTMLMSESLANRRHDARGHDSSLRRCGPRRSLSGLRHDLQRHAGPAGRRGQPAARQARST